MTVTQVLTFRVEAVLNDRHVQTKDASGTRPLHKPSRVRDCINARARPLDGLSTREMVELPEQGLIAEMPEIMLDYFSMDPRRHVEDQEKGMPDGGLSAWADRKCRSCWAA